jgi:hypothetical protein
MGANVADGSKAAVATRFGHVRFTLIADIGCRTSDVRSVLPAQPVDARVTLTKRRLIAFKIPGCKRCQSSGFSAAVSL